MIEFADRDPVLLEITDVSTQTTPQLMPALKPRRENQVWVCEYVSVWITEKLTNSTPNTYTVELGIDHRNHITWLDYITLTSGLWTRILDHPLTLLTNMLPRCRFYCADTDLIMQMNVIGYVRAPFTTP